jgi:hypothetical protein
MSSSNNQVKVWVIKPEMDAVAENEMLGHPYPEDKSSRQALLKKWFPRGFEVKQWYLKEDDIMEYFVVFFDAEEGGLCNEMAYQIAKACGVASTGNFVVMRKKWVGEEERTVDMGVSVFEFLSFIQPKKEYLGSIKISGNFKCVPECVPRKMMGTSWWKCLGYNSPCGCAEFARLNEPNEVRVEKAPAPKSFLNAKMDISIVCCRNIVGVFPDKYVCDGAPKAVRELYMNYWIEFCKEQGVDAKGGTMMIFGGVEDMLEMYPNGLKNVVIAPLYSEERKRIGDEDGFKFCVTCGHMSVDSEFSRNESLLKSGLSSKEIRDMAVGMAKLDMEEKWVEYSKHRLRDVPMSFADSDSPAVPPEKQCVFCGCDWGEYGNNAEPVSEGMCCDDCNRNVILNFRRADKKKCDRKCSVGKCDCEAKNAEAERNNKIVDIIGEQVLASCVKISGIVSLDDGMPQDYINKRISASEVKLVAEAVKADEWVKKSVEWCLAKGKVTVAEAVQGLDSFIVGLGYRSEVKQVYYRIAERLKAEDAENARLQAIAEAELMKVIAEAEPEKKVKAKTAKQLEAEATRKANAEKKKAEKAKAEFEAKAEIAREANRKKAQDKQKAIAKAKRLNQMKMAEQALASQVGKSDK